MKKYLFEIPIGDWSNDGHGMCDHFVIESNVSMNKIFDAYFKAQEELPKEICPEGMCESYRDGNIPADIVKKLREYNFTHKFDSVSNSDGSESPSSEDMLEIVLWFIKQGNNKIKLKVVKLDKFINWKVPKKHKGKNLGNFGYGLFDH
jgi:hypothetical protein